MSQGKWADRGDNPEILELIYNDLFGSSRRTLLEFLKSEYPSFRNCKVLSLCSGNGSFEKNLLKKEKLVATLSL